MLKKLKFARPLADTQDMAVFKIKAFYLRLCKLAILISFCFPVIASDSNPPWGFSQPFATDPCAMREDGGYINPNDCRAKQERERATEKTEQDRQTRQDEWDLEDRQRQERERLEQVQQEAEEQALRQAKEAEEAARRQEQDWVAKEKELKEKCEQAEDSLYAKLEEKKETVRSYDDNFFSIEERISQAKQDLTEDDIKLSEAKDRLRRESNQAVQELKDGLRGELDGRIDGQIRQMEAAIDQLSEAASQIQEAEMDLFNAKIKVKNQAYAGCYDIAVQETLKKREEYIGKARAGRLRRRTMDGLLSGGKSQTLNNFNAYFQQAINRCLNNQAQVLKNQDMEREIRTKEEKLELKRAQIKEKQDKIKAQIKELNTEKRLEVLTRFKEKMEEVVKEFNIAFERLSKTAKQRRKHTLAKINSFKQEQARVLARKEEEMDMDSRFRAKVTECQQEQALNLFKTNQERQQAWLKQRQQNQQRIFQQRRKLANDYLWPSFRSSSLKTRGASSVK